MSKIKQTSLARVLWSVSIGVVLTAFPFVFSSRLLPEFVQLLGSPGVTPAIALTTALQLNIFWVVLVASNFVFYSLLAYLAPSLISSRRTLRVLVSLLAVLLIASLCITSVPRGHVGVLTAFGHVTKRVLPEGRHIVWPWMAIHHMVRRMWLKLSVNVPSNDGVQVELDVSLLYQLNSAKAAEVFRAMGTNYVEDLVTPSLEPVVRSVTASYSANAIHGGEREVVGQEIAERLRGELEPQGIIVEHVLIRDVQLPANPK